MKKCGKCELLKDEKEFHKNKNNPDGLHFWCKECRKVESSNYLKDNKEQISVRKSEHYRDNKQAYSEKNKAYYIDNRQTIIDKTSKYRQNHKNERNLQEQIRYNKDNAYRLRKLVSSTVLKALKNIGSSKNGSSILKHLPYTIQELKDHLEEQFEPWMSWKNQGNYDPKTWNDNDPNTWTWQIDHIIPRSKLSYTSMKDDNFKKCWGLKNLRPYPSKLNVVDGATRIRHGDDNE
jgi:hypothetical protein